MGGAGKGPGRNQRRIEADQGEAGTGSEKAGNENSERERCGNAEAPPKRQRNGGWKTGQNRAEQTEQNKPKRPERSNRSNNLRKKFVSCRKQRRPNMELSDKKFAVLIDADNISHRKIKDILDEIANCSCVMPSCFRINFTRVFIAFNRKILYQKIVFFDWKFKF